MGTVYLQSLEGGLNISAATASLFSSDRNLKENFAEKIKEILGTKALFYCVPQHSSFESLLIIHTNIDRKVTCDKWIN